MTHTHPAIIQLPPLTTVEAWDTPVFFDIDELPDIPARLLPHIFQQFASDLARATETPEALSVMVLLGVISTIVAKRFVVSPKKGWHEPLNIYVLIALPPANHKSLVLNHCTKPLIEWEKQQTLQMENEIKRQCSDRKTQERIIETLRAKAAKVDDKDEQQRLRDEITQMELALNDTPSLPLLFVNDVTPESLTNLVHEQGGKLAIFSDEGGILETLAGLYSHGSANIDILLKGIDGSEVRVRRKERSITLNPYLTIVLAVQPTIIQTMSDKRAYIGNGTLERFLYVIPRSKLGYRAHNTPPLSDSVQYDYHRKIKQLLDNYFFVRDVPMEHPHVLKLSPQASQAWFDFQVAIEYELRPEGKLFNCLGWGGKICGFALRIAGLLHIMESEESASIITEAIMNNALQMARLLIEHGVAAFGIMGNDQVIEDAKLIYSWIKSRKQLFFSQTDLSLALRNKKTGKTERVQKALQLLQARNLISEPIKLATRKPTTIYHVNPAIFSSINT